MYNYTTTSASHPSFKQERKNNSSSYIYTTTSTPSYIYTTTSSSSSSNYSPTDNETYRFSLTSDYLKHKKKLKDSHENDYYSENESEEYNYEPTRKYFYTTTSESSKSFYETTSSLADTSIESTTSQDRECIICVDTYDINQFEKITKNCLHSNDICKKCVSQHIETQLDTKGDVEGILCPFGDSCGFLLEHSDVQRILKNVNFVLFERYDGLSLKQALSSMADFRWCKNASCGSGQIHSGGSKEPIMTCKACGERSCYAHDIPWHNSLTCEEYDEAKKGEDIATQDLLNRETKKCPKCGVRITKNGGCNHMTCRVQKCRHEFCWLCLADYNQIRRHGNHFHQRTCQLYA